MRYSLVIIALAVIAATLPAAAAQQPSFITSYSEFTAWLPVIIVAVTLSIMITGIYYLAGVALQSKDIKSRAVGEFGQAVGTIIIVVMLIAVLWFFGTGELSLENVVSPASLSLLCGPAQLGASKVSILSSTGMINDVPSPTNTICSVISLMAPAASSSSSLPSGISPGSIDITPRLDYGLLASYVIIANVTNQAADNLNAFYIFEGWMGYLSKLVSTTGICTPSPTCIVPASPSGSKLSVTLSVTPLAGYLPLTSVNSSVEFEAVLTFYILFFQLLVILLFLFVWPYLLAAGVILRAMFFTRRAGGLLMGIGISVALIYPLMYVLEYGAFANTNLSPIGATNLPSMQLSERLTDGTLTTYGSSGFNFFILPNAKEVIEVYGCMPPHDNLMVGEVAAALPYYFVPGLGPALTLIYLLGNTAGGISPSISSILSYSASPNSGVVCTPDQAISTSLALLNLYGIVSVLGITLPMINVLIALAMITNLTRLLGGDTDLLGISKLI